MVTEIKTSEYFYELPDDRIALHPLAQRDRSKLLVYKQRSIDHRSFYNLPSLLPTNSTLFFNDTKVIPARLLFKKETGAEIELFLLNPDDETLPLQMALQSVSNVRWRCTVGNLKKWKQGTSLQLKTDAISLTATLVDPQHQVVDLSWLPADHTFADVVEKFGNTPLPPYLHREAGENDKSRYQTVYSKNQGAVAAPTAGLHFTDKVLKELTSRSIKSDFLTLHVSAGTFQPVKSENALEHTMHSEQLIVTKKNMETLLQPDRKVIAVGTTSMRTLESLYWYGTKLLLEGPQEFKIEQNDPYRFVNGTLPTTTQALERVAELFHDRTSIIGQSSIYIVPGYTFRVCEGLITNFHQPGSTLMLLVAAFVGKDWKLIYEEALQKDYRFLSYGDSSLLLP